MIRVDDWKPWGWVIGAVVALVAIYVFANPSDSLREDRAPQELTGQRTDRPRGERVLSLPAPPGIEPLRTDFLEPVSGRYRSARNLFAYVEPPPPPPPKPPTPPPPPPDRDTDGIPDFQDNCPDKQNSDQIDIDRNGMGDACQSGPIVPPPPPPPTPPEFNFKFMGSFGTASRPMAAFSSNGEIVNARVGDTIGGRFILLNIGIESVDIGFVGFPPDVRKRVAVSP